MCPLVIHRSLLGTSLIIIFSTVLIFSTCKEKNEICLDCANGTIQSSFNDRYFRIGVNSKFEFQLYSFDPSKSVTGLGYGFCEFAKQSTIDSIDVIKASGDIKWACNKADSFLVVKTFKTVDVCQIAPPVLIGNFPLSGRYWYCESIFFNNKTFIAPCGFSPGIEFKNGMYSLTEVVNSTAAAYSPIGSDSIKLLPGPITLVIAKTQYQRIFENNLDAILGRVYPYNSVNVWYQINDNRLIIKSKKGTIQLFSKN